MNTSLPAISKKNPDEQSQRVNGRHVVFSKYWSNFNKLQQDKTIRSLNLDQFVCNCVNQARNLASYPIDEGEQFFRCLVDYLRANKTLVTLEFTGAYSCEYNRANKFDPEVLYERTLAALLEAFILNYSLLEIINIDWLFYQILNMEGFLKNRDLYNLLQTSLKEFGMNEEVHSFKSFLAAIIKRNKLIAAKLRQAAASGDDKTVKALLDKGASVFSSDEAGKTAMDCAAENGHKKIAALLKQKGAVANVRTEAVSTQLKSSVADNTFLGKIMGINNKPKEQQQINTIPSSAQSRSPKSFFDSLTRFFTFANETKPRVIVIHSCVTPPPAYENKTVPIAEPEAKRDEIARQIADAAITGAINGLASMPNYEANDERDPYAQLKGLSANASFDKKDRLINLIVAQLKASQEPLAELDFVKVRCLMGCLARTIKDNIIKLDDSGNDSVNSDVKVVNKIMNNVKIINLLDEAIDYALTDAKRKAIEAEKKIIPSAPPWSQEEQFAHMYQQQGYVPSTLNYGHQ